MRTRRTVTQLESHSPRRSRREAERNRAAYGAGPVTPEYPPNAPDHRMPRGTDRGAAAPPAPPPAPPPGRTGRPVPPGGGRPLAPGSGYRGRQAPQAPQAAAAPRNPEGPYPAQGYAAPQSRREAYQQQPVSRRDSRDARA